VRFLFRKHKHFLIQVDRQVKTHVSTLLWLHGFGKETEKNAGGAGPGSAAVPAASEWE
jgi:hypothetical protein